MRDGQRYDRPPPLKPHYRAPPSPPESLFRGRPSDGWGREGDGGRAPGRAREVAMATCSGCCSGPSPPPQPPLPLAPSPGPPPGPPLFAGRDGALALTVPSPPWYCRPRRASRSPGGPQAPPTRRRGRTRCPSRCSRRPRRAGHPSHAVGTAAKSLIHPRPGSRTRGRRPRTSCDGSSC